MGLRARIEERVENRGPLLRVVEGFIAIGMLTMWAGLLHFHIMHKEAVIPEGLPRNRAVKALVRMIPELDSMSFWLAVIGASLSALFGLVGLVAFRSDQKSKYIGIYASFTITVSAWHLFRIEGKETLEKYNKNPSVDLWAPITSNVVMMFMAMLLMHHNLFSIRLFDKLPPVSKLVCKTCVIIGVVASQIYFSVLLLLNFKAGVVLLATSPFLILIGYLGGQLWEYLHVRSHSADETETAEAEILIEHNMQY
jgi:hypothetical protein